jgi:putative ABC transport system permease protein
MSDLLDLSQSEKDANINPSKTYYDNGETVGKITPYGFNGVFTHKKNGSAVLNGGLSLYSPSGIYPGNDALDSDVVANILKQTANLEVANIITGIINLPPTGDEKTSIGQDIDNAFKAWQTATSDSDKEAKFKAMTDLTGRFVNKLTEIYGRTAVASLVNGAIDRDSTHVIFANLSNTISQVESTVLAIVSLMVIIIVMLITVMLIGDSKKLAAVLKALGYSDRENASSFLSIYVPVIAVGLLLSIPLSFALIFGFQAIIFSGAGILLTASVKWWSFLVGVCAICSVFTASGFWGYASLKRERLIDMMKG